MLLKLRRIESVHSRYFDMWRGGSAVAVVIGHVFQVFSPSHQRLFSTLAGFAVMAFFALSGFFIHKSLSRCFQDSIDWRSFVAARVDRILPPFVVSLLLTILLWGVAPYFFASGSHSFLTPTSRTEYSLDGVWQTVFFLNGFIGTTLSANGVLWSLTYEVWYYVLGCLLSMALMGSRVGWVSIPLLIVLTTANKYFAIQGLVWAGGFFVSILHANAKIPVLPRLPMWLLPAALLIWMMQVPETMLSRAGLISMLLFGVWMVWHMAYVLGRDNVPQIRWLAWSASFSYTLYITHFPILLFIYGISENAALPALVVVLLLSALIGPRVEALRFATRRWH